MSSQASWKRPIWSRTPASMANADRGGSEAWRLAEEAHHLVRDQRGLLEPARDDVARLHPVENLRTLRARAHAVAEGERAVEHAAQLRGRPAHGHPVARGEHELELELPAVAARARGQLAEQRQAAADEGYRLVVGVDALGDDRRPRVVGDRLLAEAGALEVRGDLGADGIEILLVRARRGPRPRCRCRRRRWGALVSP